MQGQGFRRVEIFEGSMDDIQKGAEDMFRELQGAFSFGFGMFPELEDRMAHEMRRLFRPDASTSSRWENDLAAPRSHISHATSSACSLCCVRSQSCGSSRSADVCGSNQSSQGRCTID